MGLCCNLDSKLGFGPGRGGSNPPRLISIFNISNYLKSQKISETMKDLDLHLAIATS